MKKIIAVMLVLFLCVALAGCESAKADYKTRDIFPNLVEIAGEDSLYYDSDTKVVYIVFSIQDWSGHQGYGYMSPYYADNGLPYVYDISNQRLVKIEGQNRPHASLTAIEDIS